MAEEQEAPGAWAQRIMAVMAHPDDPDFSCGGTFAKWAAEGKEIIYVLFTRGDKGTSDPDMTPERLAAIREEEQRAAAKVLGVKDVIFLGHPDGEVEDTREGRGQVVKLIREFRPDILVTMDPFRRYVQHRDHRNAAIMAMDAVYPYARDRLSYPEHEQMGLAPHKVGEIFIAGPEEPEFFIDIRDTFEKKVDALMCHRSQVGDDRAAFVERLQRMARRFTSSVPEGFEPGKFESFRKISYRGR